MELVLLEDDLEILPSAPPDSSWGSSLCAESGGWQGAAVLLQLKLTWPT